MAAVNRDWLGKVAGGVKVEGVDAAWAAIDSLGSVTEDDLALMTVEALVSLLDAATLRHVVVVQATLVFKRAVAKVTSVSECESSSSLFCWCMLFSCSAVS